MVQNNSSDNIYNKDDRNNSTVKMESDDTMNGEWHHNKDEN